MKIKYISVVLLLFMIFRGQSQSFDLGYILENPTSHQYVKLSTTAQFWARNAQYNPGTTVFGTPKSGGTDLGIRRFRVLLYGQLSSKVFFFSQLGINNFNSISDRKLGFFVHDVYADYALVDKKVQIGMGLSGWSGFSRFSSPSIGTLMGLDAPLFLQATNDVNDQFLRKLSVFAKGKFGRLDYRLVAAQPLAIQKSAYNPPISRVSSFSSLPPNFQYSGYFQYQFKDIESNLTPYTIGTYLGKKTVINVGAGFVYQKDAVFNLADNNKDTVMNPLQLFSADFYLDKPIRAGKNSISVYLNYSNLNYGKQYFRNLGVMNPANGDNQSNVLNGGGVGYAAYGTGNVFYGQVGFKFNDSLITQRPIMPYVSLQSAKYDRFEHQMNVWTMGATIFMVDHKSKVSIAYERRPIFLASDTSNPTYKGSTTLQYQVNF